MQKTINILYLYIKFILNVKNNKHTNVSIFREREVSYFHYIVQRLKRFLV